MKNNRTARKIYFSYTTRLVFEIIMFLALLIFGTILLNKSLKYEKTEIIEYNEKSNLDYKVYLLKNEFYEEPYLGKDMLYVASLIDKIKIDFKYKFEVEDLETLDFTYKIVGKLSITNKEGTSSYYEKTYTLLDDKQITMQEKNNQEINETIDINYPYYNSLANDFKNSYGVDTNSKLTVFMLIDKKSNEKSNFSMSNSSMMNVSIPLSERSINIELDYDDISKSSSIIKNKNVEISNIILLVLSILFIIIGLIVMIKAMRKLSLLGNKKSAFDKHIKKILKEYDRLIAETLTMISLEDKEVIKLDKFTELLDIHDNLQLPIMYYSITEHQKACFYINHDKTVYIITIKAIDLENYKIEK